MKLFHGSMFLNDDGYLMPGYLRSGTLVKWDKTESNEWLYVILDQKQAETLGVASAIEKVFATKRFTEMESGEIKIECYSDGDSLSKEDLLNLDVYIYEIEHKLKDEWIYVNNEHNGIDDELKTKNKVRFKSYYKLDIAKWIKDRKVTITRSDVKSNSMESASDKYKPVESDKYPGWFEIKGYPSHLANRDGRVKNAKTGFETKGSPDDKGYMRTSIWNNDKGSKKDVKIHVLICTAFNGPKPKGCEVGHNDDNRGNNEAKNLRWVTRQDNMKKRHSMESSSFKW